MASEPLSSGRVDELIASLGLDGRPDLDHGGLHAAYSAWCRRVPFDNLHKLIALAADAPQLPGIDPVDFFAMWDATGAGSTCWASNNALCALLSGLGFDAELWSASMFDGEMNHGTTVVTIDDRRWVVDTALHGDVPLPLIEGTPSTVDHCGYRTTVRPDPGGWIVDHPTPDPDFVIPCRLLVPIEHAVTVEANEKSRGWSPFNANIMAAINDDDGAWTLNGSTLVRVDRSGITSTELAEVEADEFLIGTVGHTPELVAEVRRVIAADP